jgi:hypothetical protein
MRSAKCLGLGASCQLIGRPQEPTEQRKAKDRERKRLKRAKAGARSRQAYLVNAKTQKRPWDASGVSRSTCYRRRMRQVRPRQDLTTNRTTCLTVPRATREELVSASGTSPRLTEKRRKPKDHCPQVLRTDLSQEQTGLVQPLITRSTKQGGLSRAKA